MKWHAVKYIGSSVPNYNKIKREIVLEVEKFTRDHAIVAILEPRLQDRWGYIFLDKKTMQLFMLAFGNQFEIVENYDKT